MDIEKVKEASELNEKLSNLIRNKSEILSHIDLKERMKKGEYFFNMTPIGMCLGNYVFVNKSIEDELMEIAIGLLDKKIKEVEKQISEL